LANIAVIGGGLFGSVAAHQLASAGHSVVVFEKKTRLMISGSANNTNRLHLGFHYPRDLNTALQSSQSSVEFNRQFSHAVRNNFENFYGLALEGSKTSLSEYQVFLEALGENHSSAQTPQILADIGFPFDKMAGLWRTAEGIISMENLADELQRALLQQSVQLRFRTEVLGLDTSGDRWAVETARGSEIFDIVVMATYGTPVAHPRQVDCSCSSVKKYELTLVLEVSSPTPAFGLTILDGDFLTVLPSGTTDNFLLYAPGPSVLKTVEGPDFPEGFAEASPYELRVAEGRLIERVEAWIPGFEIGKILERRTTVRTLLSGVEATDARPSKVLEHGPGLFELWSGKLDHSVSTAEELANQLN
jgi:hypothetical protein